MSLSAALATLALATAGSAAKTCAPDPPVSSSPAGSEAIIRKAEQDWAASVSRNEAAFLRRSTSENFTAVLEGKVLTRAALIREAEQRRPGDAKDTLTSLHIHLYGATAVAEGTELWIDRAPPRRTRIVWSDLWVHCGGVWRLVSSSSVGSPAN